jgi:hypothetical protein
MAFITADRTKEITATTGTGALTLGGAVVGFQPFSASMATGDQCYYALQAVDSVGNPSGAWETGVGTYTLASNTLSRALVSSSTGSLINLTGVTAVWIDIPAQQIQGYNRLPGKNRIVNGDCRIIQFPSAAFTSGLGGYAGPTRFKTSNNSAGGQFTQSSGTITYGGISRPACVQTVNTAIATTGAGNYWFGFNYLMEGYDTYDMIGSPATLSFIWNTNVTGGFTVAISDSNRSYTFLTTFSAVANVPQRVIIQIPTLPSSLTIGNNASAGLQMSVGALNTGTYFGTPNPNAWQAGNFITATGWTNWGSAANNFIAIAELQLESGTVLNPVFERIPLQQDYANCLRYFQAWGGAQVGVPSLGGGDTNRYWFGNYYVPMRTTPTLVLTGNVTFSLSSNTAYGFECSFNTGDTTSTRTLTGWTALADF